MIFDRFTAVKTVTIDVFGYISASNGSFAMKGSRTGWAAARGGGGGFMLLIAAAKFWRAAANAAASMAAFGSAMFSG